MAVSILLVTHKELGTALVDTVTEIFVDLPMRVRAFPIDHLKDIDELLTELRAVTHTLDTGDGVLVLTDVFGATPNNLARKLQDDENIEVISGLNLPMLIQVLNYPHLELLPLAQKALCGGRDGVSCNNELISA